MKHYVMLDQWKDDVSGRSLIIQEKAPEEFTAIDSGEIVGEFGPTGGWLGVKGERREKHEFHGSPGANQCLTP